MGLEGRNVISKAKDVVMSHFSYEYVCACDKFGTFVIASEIINFVMVSFSEYAVITPIKRSKIIAASEAFSRLSS